MRYYCIYFDFGFYNLQQQQSEPSARPKSQQIVGLDLLRLLAALSVVFYHYAFQASVPGRDAFEYSNGLASYPALAPFAQFGWMGVPAFFVISGFVISFSASAAKPASFLTARILRLGPAVWICAPLTALVIYLSGRESFSHIFGRLFNSMTFFPFGSQIDGVYWTLRIEVFFYTAVFFFLVIGRYSLFSKYNYAIATISALFNLMPALGLQPIDLGKWTDLLLIRHGCEFAFGALVYEIHRDGSRIHRLIFALVALAGTFLQVIPAVQGWPWAPEFLIWSSFVAAFLAIVAGNRAVLAVCSPQTLTAIRQIGKATYPIYLVHQIVGVYLIFLLVTARFSAYQALAIATVAIFILTAVICVIEEKLRDAVRPTVERAVNRLARTAPAKDRARENA